MIADHIAANLAIYTIPALFMICSTIALLLDDGVGTSARNLPGNARVSWSPLNGGVAINSTLAPLHSRHRSTARNLRRKRRTTAFHRPLPESVDVASAVDALVERFELPSKFQFGKYGIRINSPRRGR